METFKSFESKLYSLNEASFQDIALEVFRQQAIHNTVYNAFITHLRVDIQNVTTLKEIPFLPISFFKTHDIRTGTWQPDATFTSSGTVGSVVSKHPVQSVDFYLSNARHCFQQQFGPLDGYHFLALLPSYLERQGSSLIAMMDYFIKESHSPWSGFYLADVDKLLHDIAHLRHDGRKTILWGVSFALLDLAERHATDLSHCLVFETGGMKGRRKEITRQELHKTLKNALNVDKVYSEYGMTELLSQAYTGGDYTFRCPPWMKIIGRDLTDPLHRGLLHDTAGINVVDLANWHSIAFIETEDLGKVYADGSFEVLGRIDNSDIRGCNLLLQ